MGPFVVAVAVGPRVDRLKEMLVPDNSFPRLAGWLTNWMDDAVGKKF